MPSPPNNDNSPWYDRTVCISELSHPILWGCIEVIDSRTLKYFDLRVTSGRDDPRNDAMRANASVGNNAGNENEDDDDAAGFVGDDEDDVNRDERMQDLGVSFETIALREHSSAGNNNEDENGVIDGDEGEEIEAVDEVEVVLHDPSGDDDGHLLQLNDSSDEDDGNLLHVTDKILVHIMTAYTPNSTTIDELVGQSFWYQSTDLEELRQLYNESFPPNAFNADGSPRHGSSIQKVSARIQSHRDELIRKLKELEEETAKVKARYNVACAHEKLLTSASKGANWQQRNFVRRSFRNSVNTQLSAEGGDTNAELTLGSMELTADILKEKFNIGKEDVIVDGGCSFNTFCAYMTILLECRAYGIEYVVNRQYLGANSYLLYLKNAGTAANLRLGYIPTDLFKMDSFPGATVVYLFDEVSVILIHCVATLFSRSHYPMSCIFGYLQAFPEALYEHVCRMIANTPTIKVVITFKPSKTPGVLQILKEVAGFDVHVTETLKKQGLGGTSESNTGYFCKRPEGATMIRRNVRTKFDDFVFRTFVLPTWEGDRNEIKKLYQNIFEVAEFKMKPKTREASLRMAVVTLYGTENDLKVTPDAFHECLVIDVAGRAGIVFFVSSSPTRKRARRVEAFGMRWLTLDKSDQINFASNFESELGSE